METCPHGLGLAGIGPHRAGNSSAATVPRFVPAQVFRFE
jgi:hypothetical protein